MSARERHPGDRLAALVDGRLGEPDRSRVIEHLTRCRDCLADYDAQLNLKGLLGGLDSPTAPIELRDRLSELITAQRAEPAPVPRAPVSRRARVSAVAVAFTFVATGGAYLLGGTEDGAPVVPPVDQYVREHAAVSVGVPLTGPALYQLVQAPSSVLVDQPVLVTPVNRR
jgi:anti-sigma factor RsiW